MEAWDPQQYT
jgi:hypothetical protein